MIRGKLHFSEAQRSMPTPWVERPTIDLDEELPLDEKVRSVPEDVFQQARKLLAALRQDIPAAAQRLAPMIRLRTLGRFQREAVALAERAGTDWREIIVASIAYELVLSIFGCSTIALATAEGPVLARNMDWWPEGPLARASYQFRHLRQGRLTYATAGWPGALGAVSGLSGRGFAVALNAVVSGEGISYRGYPVLLFLRCVLEDAPDFTAAVQMLSRQRLAAAALFTVVGTRNDERVVIERTPGRHALRQAEGDEPLLATNHFRSLHSAGGLADSVLGELGATTCGRYDTLCSLLSEQNPTGVVTDEHLLYILSDPNVRQQITAQHILARPRQQQVRLLVPRHLLDEAEIGEL